MADTQGVMFDRRSAARIAKAVRAWEREPVKTSGPKTRPYPESVETVFAKLTSRGSTDKWKYAWTEQRRKYDGTWEDLSGGRTGTIGGSEDNPAHEINGDTTDWTNKIVLLRRMPICDDSSTDVVWNPGWGFSIAGTCTGATVKITSAITSAGGKYYGVILTGTSTATATGNLAMPEGLTEPGTANALVLNIAEDGRATHWIRTNTRTNGRTVGSVTISGTVYTIVLVDIPNQQATFAVDLTKTGGSQGTASTAPSWVYTAEVLGTSQELGTSLTPQTGRTNGQYTEGTLGLGYFDDSNTFKLLTAFETPVVTSCSVVTP